jgi:predicted ArsR family transcriptional regulator
MVDTLIREGSTSAPALASELPISRQAVAKHLAVLDHAGLLERAAGQGREVRYRLREGAIHQAAAWIAQAERRWDQRLERLKTSVEGDGAGAAAPAPDH